MNAYIIYLDEAAQDPSARWSMYTVPGVDSITHDDRTASLYSDASEKQHTLVGVVRLSEAVSVVLAAQPPQLGGLTQAPVRSVPPRPVVTSLAPMGGPTAGGTEVEIGGNALADATGVFFGVKPAQTFNLVSIDGPIHAVAPAGTGVVDVTVTTPGGTSATTSVDQYVYADPALPVVSGVTPASGRAAGGETVQVLVNSIDVKGVNAFLFGSIPAPSFSLDLVRTDGTLSYLVQTPPNSGEVNVTVVTTIGSSYPTAETLFTFVSPPPPGPPAISAVSPATGVTIGGATVRLEGTDLGDASSVMFGTVPAESFSAKLLNQNTVVLEAVSPCGQGAAPITVSTLRGTSAVSAVSQFAYTVPAVLGTVSFATQTVGTASGAKSTTVPLQASLRDLPQNLVVPYSGGNSSLDLVLRSAGLGPQFTIGQLIAAFGDITVSYAIAGFNLDRTAGDFSFTVSTVGGGPVTVSVSFKPTAKGYRADVLRASVGGLHLSGTGVAGVLASFANVVAPSLTALVNSYVAVLLEGDGI